VNNDNESFDYLAHEKKISELYQNNKQHQAEEPSVEINAKIMAMAQQQLSDNPSLLNKDSLLEQQQTESQNNQSKSKNTWQWPFSLVASVGLLGVLFITQQEYFINPTHVESNDAGLLNEPVIPVPYTRVAETVAAELAVRSSQTAVTTQIVEQRLNTDYSALATKRVDTKSVSINQAPNELKKQMLDRPKLEDNSAMSLFEMSKLAESLKRKLAIESNEQTKARATSLKMQQTLFEHLLKYQNSHAEFILTEEFLCVLTEEQVQALQFFGTDAVIQN
jgi:hypothetical protein